MRASTRAAASVAVLIAAGCSGGRITPLNSTGGSEPPRSTTISAVPTTTAAPTTVAETAPEPTEPPPTEPAPTEPPPTEPPPTQPPPTEPPPTLPPTTVIQTTTTAYRPPSTAAVTGVYYANCSQAKAAGAAPLYRGQPGYRSELDRDNDGVACET